MSSPPLRDVLAIMDRMEGPALADVTERQALVARVHDVCEAGGLPTQGIEAAVDAHLAAAQTPPGAKPISLQNKGTFGWQRPRSLEEQQRWATPSRGRRFVANVADDGYCRLGTWVCGLALAILVSFSMGTGFNPWWIVAGAMTVSTLAWRAVVRCGRQRREAQEVFPSLDQLNRWAAGADTRAYIQQCMGSACPMLMQGDLDHLTALGYQQLQIKRQQSLARQAEQERQRVQDQFHQAMAEQDSKRSLRQQAAQIRSL